MHLVSGKVTMCVSCVIFDEELYCSAKSRTSECFIARCYYCVGRIGNDGIRLGVLSYEKTNDVLPDDDGCLII